MRFLHVFYIRLDPEQPDFKIPPGQSLSCLISGKYWQVSRTDSMPNWFVGAEGMDPVVIGNTVSEDLNYVSKFDTSNKWKRYPDDQYNPYSPPTRYGIHKDIADRGLAIKPLIPSPKNLKIDRNKAVLIGGRTNRLWAIQSDGNFPTATRDLAGQFYHLAQRSDFLKFTHPLSWCLDLMKKILIENCIDAEYIFGDWEKKTFPLS